VTRSARGFAAGVAATLPMSAFMLAADRGGWMSEPAPAHITRTVLDELPVPEDAPEGPPFTLVTSLLHLGFGGVAGAAYALSLGHRPRLPAPVNGALFGTLVWLGSYWGVLPALGLMPSPPRDEPRRPVAMLAAHWVYGSVLALLAPRVRRLPPEVLARPGT
jgi:hypothetical protein